MEAKIRTIITKLIEECQKFEIDTVCENGDIKEEFQETLIDKYTDIIDGWVNQITLDDLGIIVENEKELIKKFYVIYYILDERVYTQLNSEIGANPGWKAEAQIRLHMMYLKTFREVIFLLASGFSDCALARTRTLYELCVYINIINQNSEELAERFCKYCNVQSLKLAREMNLEEKIEMITETLDSFNFESEYKKENGWARILFPNITPNRNISFYDLAELTQYKEYRNMYKMACNFVHGSLFSSLESLDSAATQRRKNFWNTSPSNDGIEAITSMLKIYITTFIAEYTHKFSDKTYLENMLIIFLYGKELLEMDEEASM